MGRYTGKTCRLIVMLSLTFGFFLVEIVFGYITNSMALIADSFHMLSDVLALIIAFCCMKISKKKSTKNTFGWVRAEVLGALINAVFLMALCFSIVVEAIKRLVEPDEIEQPDKILIVGVLGLVINIIGIFMFHGHASIHGHSHARPVPLDLPAEEEDDDDDDDETLSPVMSKSHNISVLLDDEQLDRQARKRSKADAEFYTNNVNNHSAAAPDKKLLQNDTKDDNNRHSHKEANAAGQLNMHGVFLHILGDAFGSIIVVVNALICKYVDSASVKKYLDPSLSLVIALIITCTTLPLLKESALILLQTVPTHIDVQETKAKMLKTIDGVLAVHEFHVWRLAGNKIIATAHIRCKSLEDYMKIAERVKQFFHHEGIHSTTIQPEFAEQVGVSNELHSDDECVLECPKESLCAPSTCCGPKPAITTVRFPDSSSNPNPNSNLVVSSLNEQDQTHQGYPPMTAAQPPVKPQLQRRLSKSEDNLTGDGAKKETLRIGPPAADFCSTPKQLNDKTEIVDFSSIDESLSPSNRALLMQRTNI